MRAFFGAMVNFKGSSHAGAHKRALAGGEAEQVSKLDKLPQQEIDGCAWDKPSPSLTVHPVPIEDGEARPIKACLVSPAVYARLAQGGPAGPVFVRRPGSDCVLTARASAQVADGTIGLTDVQCRNLRVCAHEQYAWERFSPSEPLCAVGALFVEVWLIDPSASGGDAPPEVDGPALCAQLRAELFGHVVCDSELLALTERKGGTHLALRVSGVLPDGSQRLGEGEVRPPAAAPPALWAYRDGNSDGDGGDGDDGEQAGGGPIVERHVWRGLVGAETLVLASRLEPPLADALDGHRQPSTRFELRVGAEMAARMAQLRAAPRSGEVHVVCSDGEWFPVHASLLKPCIALNRAVRQALGAGAGGGEAPGAPRVSVAVDTLSFDRALLHLEAGLRGQAAPIDIAAAEQLRPVGLRLGYRALTEQCDSVLGDFASRLRVYSWAEVVRHNTSLGGCWIVMDGMVLDVERWLPEHPVRRARVARPLALPPRADCPPRLPPCCVVRRAVSTSSRSRRAASTRPSGLSSTTPRASRSPTSRSSTLGRYGKRTSRQCQRRPTRSAWAARPARRPTSSCSSCAASATPSASATRRPRSATPRRWARLRAFDSSEPTCYPNMTLDAEPLPSGLTASPRARAWAAA